MLSNENNITKSYGEIDDVGTNGEHTTSSDGKVQNIQENHDNKKDVHKEELCLLKKGGHQTHAQVNSNLDPDSFGTTSEEECGPTTHPNKDISKHVMPVRDAVTSSDINDWMWILNYVRRWTNWTVNVYSGYVILVIAVFVVFSTYTSRVEYHINGPYIMSSGESKETTILYADYSEH